MRRELEDAARDSGGVGGHRSSSPVGSLGRGTLGGCEGGNGGVAFSEQDCLNDDLECGGGTGGYYNESLPNSVHMKFVG